MREAVRLAGIEPFHVMALLERARQLEAAGRSIIHMEIGEPDFPTPGPVLDAAARALRESALGYTPAAGLPALRAAISAHYPLPARPDPARVIVTPGASGAFQLVFGAMLDPGGEVLLADPGYPCNRNFVRLFEGQPVLVPVGPDTGYQLTAELVAAHWTSRTRAVLVASPSNPTGTLLDDTRMQALVEAVAARDGVLIVDEIYHGLVYGDQPSSALRFSPDVFVVNSFSKFYGMTGWRIGWLVAPADHAGAIERLAQNVFIAPGTLAQHAALAALRPEVVGELERRREVLRERRDFLLPRLRELGFKVPVVPQGAFYIYAGCSAHTDDSFAFAYDLLERGGVAVTPGRDFGVCAPERHLRFSYATSVENLAEGVERIRKYLGEK